MHQLANDLGMDVLVEVHDKAELDIALSMNLKLVGIIIVTCILLKTSLNNTIDLLPFIGKHIIVVTESGIHTKKM